MEPIFIPIGIDCWPASTLIYHKLRHFSLPFDWTITYNGVSDIIKKRFDNYLPISHTNTINVASNTVFLHQKFPESYDKLERRINRFLNLLENSKQKLIFIKKGHNFCHHEKAKKDGCILKNDITDCEELHKLLSEKYPNLKYKIVLFLSCGKCFDSSKIYKSKNIVIYNIAELEVNNRKFTDLFEQIYKTL